MVFGWISVRDRQDGAGTAGADGGVDRVVQRGSIGPELTGEDRPATAKPTTASAELDGSLRIVGWDDAAVEILGWTAAEARGCVLPELLLPGRDRADERRALAQSARGVPDTGAPDSVELTVLHRDGEDRDVEVSVRRMPSIRRSRGRPRFQVRIRDLTGRRLEAARLELREEMLRQAEDLADLGFCVWEPGTDRMTWSPGLYRLFDRDPDRASPTFETWVGCVHPADRDRAAQEVMRALSTADRFEVEYRICRRDGTQRLARCVGTIERDDHGTPRQVLCTIRDVTPEAIVEHLKDEFLAVTSHELRTPLTAVHGALTLLNEGYAGVLPAKAEEMVQIAARGSDRLTRLVADLLDAERLAAGAASLEVADVNLADTVLAALAEVPEPIGSRLVRTEIPPELTVQVDPVRLRKVIAHLVSNAIKCTDECRGWVRVSVETGPNGLTLHVRDNGRGFAPDAAPFIFGRFSQVQASLTRDAEGAGLGLAIVKQIVELHAGTIHASSEGVGRGATFTVHLPQRPAGLPVPSEAERVPTDDGVPGTSRSRARPSPQAPGAR